MLRKRLDAELSGKQSIVDAARRRQRVSAMEGEEAHAELLAAVEAKEAAPRARAPSSRG